MLFGLLAVLLDVLSFAAVHQQLFLRLLNVQRLSQAVAVLQMEVPRTKLLPSILLKTVFSLLSLVQPIVNFVEAVCYKVIFSVVSVDRFVEHTLREAAGVRSPSSRIGLDINNVRGLILDGLESVVSLGFRRPPTGIGLLSLPLRTLSALTLVGMRSLFEVGRVDSHVGLLLLTAGALTPLS